MQFYLLNYFIQDGLFIDAGCTNQTLSFFFMKPYFNSSTTDTTA